MVNPLQQLAVNFSGTVRRARRNGRDYLVAPMTLINPGVLNGSKGPLLYPPDEIIKNYRAWNGMPIVVYHPHRLGQPVSATEPGILDRQGVGEVRNATSNGKLRAEGWFDLEKTRKVNPSVYNRLIKNEPIELSTGLFTDNVEQSGTFNGRQYVAIARNYRPDHLAVLPDQVGACSIRDGCGVLVNKESKMSLKSKLSLLVNEKDALGHGSNKGVTPKKSAEASAIRYSPDPRPRKSAEAAAIEASTPPGPAKIGSVGPPAPRMPMKSWADVEEAEKRKTASASPLRMKSWADVEDAEKKKAVFPLQNRLAALLGNEDQSTQSSSATIVSGKNAGSSLETLFKDEKEDNCDMEKNCSQPLRNRLAALIGNTNPEGHNQYTDRATSEEADDDDGTDYAIRRKLGDDTLGSEERRRLKAKLSKIDSSGRFGRRVENEDQSAKSKEQKDADEAKLTELDTDRPADPRDEAKDVDEAAEVHDLVNDDAESELDDDDLEASEKFKTKFQDHLDDAEEENVDTNIKLNAKLRQLVGNWDGPPEDDEDEDSWDDDQQEQETDQEPPMPEPPAPPQQPPVQPAAQPGQTPKAWLMTKIAALVGEYDSMPDSAVEQIPDVDKEVQNKLRQLVGNEWSDAAREAAAEARKNRGSSGKSSAKVDEKEDKSKKSRVSKDKANKKARQFHLERAIEPPGEWGGSYNQQGGPTMAVKLTANERKTVVDGLINNSECCWEESDRGVLNGLNDKTLAKLYRQTELVKNAEGASADQLDEDDDKDVAVEEEATKKGDSQADGKDKPLGDLDPKAGDGPANNSLSERDRRDLAFARRYRMEQRGQHIGVITANTANKFTLKQLQRMEDDVLANLASLAQPTEGDESFTSYQPNFFGAQGAGVAANAGAAEEPLQLGRIDYKELAKSR